jgi:hypothetical protein
MNRALPPNTRVRAGYYSWRNPEDGIEHGIGRDRRHAIMEAIRANAFIAAKRPSLLEKLTGSGKLWADWCDVFEKIIDDRDSSANTRKLRRSQLKRLRSIFPADKPAAQIDTADCSRAIDELVEADKARTAQALRSLLMDCFDRMIAKGWRKDNPARVTDSVAVKIKRARLPFDVFMRLYQGTNSVELKNAMALSIVSAQGREEVCHAQFKDVREGDLWIERTKTGARIRLPLELRLDCFGISLEDVMKQCRSTGVVSHFLIHRTLRAKGARVGSHMHVDVMTRLFSAELAKLGLDWGGKDAPTFHEIRSLAGRLYKEQGNVNPQELYGHKDPRTTAIYTDGRGEWVRVGVRK